MSKKPVRIQRKRTKGYRMPPNTVYVGRPTKWGNPFERKRFATGTLARPGDIVWWFEAHLNQGEAKITKYEIKRELKGKNLACWCPLDQPCHADILLEIANE